MPRLPRIKVEGAIYFVSSKGLDGEAIFKDKADYHMYMELLTKYKTQHRFKLFSYCLLPDRLYLLIETGEDATISEIMHDLNSLYTKYFNGRYTKKGHLFESRFKSMLVEKANYLLSMTRHIHRLPQDVQNYPYSSYHIYVKKAGDGIEMSSETQEVLQFLKNKDDETAYEKYCLNGDPAEIQELEKKLRRGAVVGSDSFAEEVKKRIQEYSSVQKEEGAAEIAQVKKQNKTLILMVGIGILVATGSSTYLYISKKALEDKYTAMLAAKEAEFAEKTKFENRSPIELAELNGTKWEVEMVALPAGSQAETIKDTLHFVNGKFYSERMLAQRYKPTNITISGTPGNMQTWETIQTNPDGSQVAWRGDWQGDAMKGVLSVTAPGEKPRDFSFFSLKWTYEGVAQ